MTTSPTLYATTVTVTGGRNGTIISDDSNLQVSLSTPKALGGAGGGTNPEQLFAAGYAACFQSALGLVVRKARVDASGCTIRSTVALHPNAAGYQLSVKMEIALPGVEPAVAQELLERAHQVCPYSHAVRGNIDVQFKLVEA
jgi:osmotically inducible protein OsmC